MKERQFSQREFGSNFSQIILHDYDVTTPAPREYVIQNVATLNAWDMHGNREANEAFFPGFEEDFRSAFLRHLPATASISGNDIVSAYAKTVDEVVPTRQMKGNMHQPDCIGKLVKHFGIPVAPDEIARIQATNASLAETYRKEAARWTTGS